MTAARPRLLLAPMLTAVLLAVLAPAAVAQDEGSIARRQVLLFSVPGVSFEQLLAVPEVRALARAGGAALMSQPDEPAPWPRPLPPSDPEALSMEVLDPAELGGLERVGRTIRERVSASDAEVVLVIVASTEGSEAMAAAKDELHPIVVARGAPDELFPPAGSMRTLTSDSTRRTGVVVDGDVWPTIFDFTGVLVRRTSREPVGAPIRLVDAPPPFELHERYLANRGMSVPIQTAAGIYVTIVGLVAISLLVLGARAPVRARRLAGWLPMSVPILATALLAAGHLPNLSYATVVPFVIAVTAVGTAAAVPLVRRGLLVPPSWIGVAVLLFFAIEALVGWTAALTPFLGGSELDGGRFYGLPNVFIGLLVGSSLYVAQRLRALGGFVLVLVVALFAGLPSLGVNLGGALTLFAAAGLWLAQRRWGRIGWRGVALTAVVVAVGIPLVLLAHAVWPEPTHGTRFIQEEGRSLAGIWNTGLDRLLVGWRLLERNPFGWIPVLGIPVALYVAYRPPRPVHAAFDAYPVWRDVVRVTLLAGLVAYLANDSGVAAAGLAFGLGFGAMLYVSLLSGTGNMGRA